ncbi:cobalt-precorrin-6A reductase [Mycobacterium adipatum]|jgi:precorrin-6A/cobalt-precorrin-6A reductase|uniref:Cobalt-precorrin-6A reductase n=1 Tax=Mycobacterium adipatum TaxID=1682113 RepID=A0A172UNV7_9MYCO|nr:cobalt-precorrin-6A reductase [Mycobacterium adipatum]ANE80706.1 cobalt-precorrin-6A reductase [Mycobacterium adipatum]MBI5737318.1 cobalt-precorrin-6A reductase [Mycolicibacterium neoaurum]
MRVLLLGGTGEARALAARLHPDIPVISSLAGRVPDPALPVGEVRIGGFGGAAGLAQWLRGNGITAVVDATHPFAATITANAAQAAARVGLPHLVLARPAWPDGDAIAVGSDTEAAEVVARRGYRRVFLTTGRSGTAAFRDSDAWFLIRAVTAPEDELLPAHREVLLSRGPYRVEGERKLLREFGIDALVTKNSGGAMTRAKLQAAAETGIPVVMVSRPALPAGVRVVNSVDGAVDWLANLR